MIKAYVIEETLNKHKSLVHESYGTSPTIYFETLAEAKEWLHALDNARGKYSKPVTGFSKSSFRIIKLAETK